MAVGQKQNKSKSEANSENEYEYENKDVNDVNRDQKKDSKGKGFDAFWAAYPKKVGKGAARKSFERVKVPVETLIQAVERQKKSRQWNRDDGQFIPNPATWLNQCRWEDESPESGYSDRLKERESHGMGMSQSYLEEYAAEIRRNKHGE